MLHKMCSLLLFLFFLSPNLSYSSLSQPKNDTSFPSVDCSSPDTFACPREGSCIPLDWVGDGEKDCEDGADELDTDVGGGRDDPFGMLSGRTEQSRNGSLPFNGTSFSSSNGAEIAISSSFFLPPTLAPNSSPTCPNCSTPLEAWVDQLVDMLDSHDNRSSASIFGHPKCRSLLSRACPLLTACDKCPSNTLSSPLLPWTRLQLFICELLEPTLRDHSKCLSNVPADCARWSLPTPSVFLSPHCRFLFRTLRSVQCLEASVPSECSESALEMIGPLRSEAEHWVEELRCEVNAKQENAANAAPDTDPKKAFAPVEEHTSAPPAPAVATLLPSASSVFSAIQSLSSSPIATTQSILLKSEESHFQWNAFSALAHADEICANEKGNVWKADGAAVIRAKICDRTDVLGTNQHCLEELAKREDKKCATARYFVHANASSCHLIDAFGKSIDCAVKTLNELCPTEVQEAVVAIQEQLNDEAIARQCFAHQAQSAEATVPEGDDEFPLSPMHVKCSSEQEEASLACLMELAELNGRLQRLASLQMLIADNATLTSVCEVFAQYERCLNERVFGSRRTTGANDGRCSLNSPLNGLARIGLTPLCSPRSRLFLRDRSSACLNAPLAHCHAPMEAVGRAVGAMLQGVHGQAHMCKAFYSLRSAFHCGQQTMRERCQREEGQMGRQLDEHLAEMLRTLELLGREEGCPVEEPPQLDALLSRRVLPDRLPLPMALPFPPSLRPLTVPQARPLPMADSTTPMINDNQCDEQQQQQFNDCVAPLTAFQPHPLAVIKQPRLIDQACLAFRNFSQCRVRLHCFPLWARGMSAMFDFACSTRGSALYAEVRQCIRRNIARQNIKECVVAFSHGAPQDACPSAHRLLDCAAPEIGIQCGERAVQFVREYVAVFAKAVDANCALTRERDNGERRDGEGGQDRERGTESAWKGPIAALNCTDEQRQLVRHCAAPLEALHAQLGDLFEGGLQNVLKNLNGLAPLFAQGCMLGTQFRQCLSPLASSSASSDANDRCTVSSCLVAAGAGICDQPDAAQAIDTHLGCVFKQVSEPEFGKCLRTTLVPIKQFSLASLRQALPQFVDCVQNIVQRTCGSIPLNVLRVLASKDNICPVNGRKLTDQWKAVAEEATKPNTSSNLPTACTSEMKQIRVGCQSDFLLTKYAFRPVSLLRHLSNSSSHSSLDAFCGGDFDALSQCMRRTAPCDADEPFGRARALRALSTAICSARVEFSKHARCIRMVMDGAEGRKCETQNENDKQTEKDEGELLEKDGRRKAGEEGATLCATVNATTQCLAPGVFSECGADSLEFVFSATNEYLAQIIPGNGCQLEMPSLAIQHSTGCAEQELVAFLECESHVDHFRPRPLALISNQSEWDSFCQSVQTEFKPCTETLKCRPEPAAGAALTLYDTVCEREITSRDQRRFGECLLKVTESEMVRPCVRAFRLVDFLGRDAGPRVCAAANELLQCAANTINDQCGEEALLHVYDVYNGWTSAFHSSCALSAPNLTKKHEENERFINNTTHPTPTPSTTTTQMASTKAEKTKETTTMHLDEGTEMTTTTAPRSNTNGGPGKPTDKKGAPSGARGMERPTSAGPNAAVSTTRAPLFSITVTFFFLILSTAKLSLCAWCPSLSMPLR